MKTAFFKSKITFCAVLVTGLLTALIPVSVLSQSRRKKCHKIAAQLITLRRKLEQCQKSKKCAHKKKRHHKKSKAKAAPKRSAISCKNKVHTVHKTSRTRTHTQGQPLKRVETVAPSVAPVVTPVVHHDIVDNTQISTSQPEERGLVSTTLEGSPQEKMLLRFADINDETVSWKCLVDYLSSTLKDSRYAPVVKDLKSVRNTTNPLEIGQVVEKHQKTLETPALQKALERYELGQLLALMNKRINLNDTATCPQA